MGRLAFLLITLLMFGRICSTGAGAQETPLKTMVTPLKKGYVLSVNLPQSANWEQLPGNASDGFGVLWIGSTKDENIAPASRPFINVSFRVLSDDSTFDEFVQNIKLSWKMYDTQIIYEKGIGDTFGQRTFFYAASDRENHDKCWANGQTVACDGPRRMIYQSLIAGNVQISAQIVATHPDDFEKLKPIFQRIAKTVRVIPESELDPELTSTSYSSPTVTTSKRRGHYLQNKVTIVLPRAGSRRQMRFVMRPIQPSRAGSSFWLYPMDGFPGRPTPTRRCILSLRD